MVKSGSKKKIKKSSLHSSSRPAGRKSNSESNSNDNSNSLPQIFPQHLPRPPKGCFLRDEAPYKKSFEKAVRGPYEGFVVDNAEALSALSATAREDDSIEESTIQSSLESMRQEGFFRTDVTQPFGLGTKCAKTYVTRCLVGDPGTTYKYLGLRMFAHPWTIDRGDPSGSISYANRKRKKIKHHKDYFDKSGSKKNDPGQVDRHPAIVKDKSTIRKLSQTLTKRTAMHLRDLDESRRQRRAHTTMGRPDFDICLINRMESNSDLKPFVFGGGGTSGDNNNHKKKNKKSVDKDDIKTTVSWHADSSLEHYSTIAVYQTLMGGSNIEQTEDKRKHNNPTKGKENVDERQWWVALRVAPHSEGPQASQKRRGTNIVESVVEETPPIAVSLPSGSTYYLLDDFNHHHQHTVLTTGNATTAGVRYSCTFRLLRDSHNVQDWIDRGTAAIRQFHKKGPKIWRSEQLLLTEIESEWIRQFYIQGMGNKNLLWGPYWKSAIEELLSIWSQLEFRTKQTMDLLRAAAEEKCGMDKNSNNRNSEIKATPTKADRKARDRRKKAFEKIQELVARISTSDDASQFGTFNEQTAGDIAYRDLYQPFSQLLDERAQMRELWAKREKDHVFHDMNPDCRPLEVPLKFEQQRATYESSDRGRGSFGMSPLPISAGKLKEMSKDLVQCGKAFRDGEISLLPPPWKTIEPNPDSHMGQESKETNHTKPINWSGWGSIDQQFGLELQHPWAGAVVDGEKSIETRSYTLPQSLIGKKIMIIQSSSGQAGISSLGNCINFSCTKRDEDNKIIGWCVFSSIKAYTAEKDFRADESLHLVTQESGYGWKDGVTKRIYGWVVEERGRYDESSSATSVYSSGVRRFRSLFQLQRGIKTSTREKKKTKRNRTETKNNHNGKKKKRKRY